MKSKRKSKSQKQMECNDYKQTNKPTPDEPIILNLDLSTDISYDTFQLVKRAYERTLRHKRKYSWLIAFQNDKGEDLLMVVPQRTQLVKHLQKHKTDNIDTYVKDYIRKRGDTRVISLDKKAEVLTQQILTK